MINPQLVPRYSKIPRYEKNKEINIVDLAAYGIITVFMVFLIYKYINKKLRRKSPKVNIRYNYNENTY